MTFTSDFLCLQASVGAAKSTFMQWALASTFDAIEAEIFVTKSVGELLFDGYDDLLLSMADWFGQTAEYTDKFAWFYKVRNTSFFKQGLKV